LELPARTVQILAEAYELSPDDVQQDVAVLRTHTWSSIDLLEWLRRRHGWHVSTCVYYLAALRRALSGMPVWT
jgi:hypothetical protein